MNTMLMTVFERKQEIAILLAIGWRRSRIVRMILWESALLGFLGGVIGSVLGIFGMKALEHTPTIRGLLKPDLSVALVCVSVAIAVIVGILSGLYPAWRSSRLSPSLALQG
jgi:putative ABC transport system permease protein